MLGSVKSLNRKSYIDALRIIAIILVVTNHVDINYYYYHDTTNIFTFVVSLIITIICQIDVPIFFMISGALLLKKQESIGYIWKKRIFRMFIIMLSFSIIQYIILMVRGKIEGYGLKDFLFRFLTGNIQEPYWFLYYYIGFLILLPLLRTIAINLRDEIYIYLCVIRIILDIVLPVFFYICNISVPVNSMMPFEFITSNLMYFLAGYYIENRLKDDIKIFYIIVLGILSIIMPFIYVLYNYVNYGTILDSNISRITFLLTISVFYIVKYTMKNVDNRLISKLGSCVFGIYLIESLVRMIYIGLYKYLITVTAGVVASFVYIVVTVLTSLVLVIIFKSVYIKIRALH